MDPDLLDRVVLWNQSAVEYEWWIASVFFEDFLRISDFSLFTRFSTPRTSLIVCRGAPVETERVTRFGGARENSRIVLVYQTASMVSFVVCPGDRCTGDRVWASAQFLDAPRTARGVSPSRRLVFHLEIPLVRYDFNAST